MARYYVGSRGDKSESYSDHSASSSRSNPEKKQSESDQKDHLHMTQV